MSQIKLQMFLYIVLCKDMKDIQHAQYYSDTTHSVYVTHGMVESMHNYAC